MINFDENVRINHGDCIIVSDNELLKALEIVREENPVHPRKSGWACDTVFAIFDHRIGLECEIMAKDGADALNQLCQHFNSQNDGEEDSSNVLILPLWCHYVEEENKMLFSAAMTSPNDIHIGWVGTAENSWPSLPPYEDGSDWRAAALNIINKEVDVYNAYLEKNVFNFKLHHNISLSSPVELEETGFYGNTYKATDILADFPFIDSVSLQLDGNMKTREKYWRTHETGNVLIQFLHPGVIR